ncbi:MAG: hypothetical protein EXS14_08695 [Planctomycetes bacterium]|nr:hypothetical protein [Planctomycetota bacterium]
MRSVTNTFIVALLFCAAVPLVAQSSLQPDVESRLLQMLREQAVLTPVQYEELVRISRESTERNNLEAQVGAATEDLVALLQQQGPTTAYKPGKGFAFTTADSKVSMIVGGRVQARITTKWPDAGDATYDINAPRVRFWVKGHAFNPDWQYEIQLELAGRRVTGDGPGGPFTSDARFAYAKEAWICYAPDNAFNAYAGIFSAPYSRQLLVGDSKQQFVNRWIGNDEFAPDDQTGLWIMGEIGGEKRNLLEYNVALLNGTGLNSPVNNTTLMVLGRVALNPFGAVDYAECDFAGTDFAMQFGLNAWSKKNATLNTSDHAIGGDVTVVWKGLYATAELHRKSFADGQPDATGWFIQGGFFLVPEVLELGFRHAVIDFGAVGSGDARISETLGVLGWFLDRHRLKTQLDFGLIRTTPAGAAAEDEWRLRLQTQFIF